MTILNPFPHYRDFSWSHTVPNLYWNAYSHEERIKALCCEYEKLVNFTDAIVDTINSQYALIEQLQAQIPSLVNEDVETYMDENLEDETSTLYTVVNETVEEWADERTGQVDANTAAIARFNDGSTYDELATNGFVYRTDEQEA